MRAFLLATVLFGLPANAETYAPVHDKQAFLQLISGRSLHIPMFNLRLGVLSDGTIEGSALGWAVSGTWDWNDGYFCREMDWSGTPIPHNCQLVEARGDRKLRFTTDRGAGDSASFDLR